MLDREPSGGSAVDLVVGRIKELFEKGNLRVGDPLPSERELCEMCAASRTTVREAMRILKVYGIVEVRPKTGAVIVDRRMDAVFELFSFSTLKLSRQTFLDTQGFRRLVEVGGFDTLVERSTPADIAELRAINEAMRSHSSSSEASLDDFRFHAKLVSILGNRQIDELYRLMKPVILRIMESVVIRGKFVGTNYTQHTGIVDALEGRDRLAFQYRVAEHLGAGRDLFAEEGD
ncbi:MAG: FadR family transcriptional regulator [Devosia nanyangense]|uniref:FadR family transcriptional regulator n=1 Tax=Devosia nanyangense TaxID=1228055 RepID=A0A933NWH8_9HYPH|nr:FadR family transcriptional regulator [Devosia nanyangense]